MRPSEIRQLLQLRRPTLDREAYRLEACLNIDDLRRLARRRLPRAVFDYVDGGADEEVSLRENRAGFQSWRFVPRSLRDVSAVSTEAELFGHRIALPLALCPTGYTRMMHPDGELAVARAAASHRVPYALSTVGTSSVEELATSGHDDLWFQLYVLRDRGQCRALLERAAASGFRVLDVAIDTAVSGRRERDVRNGLTIPPTLSLRALADIAVHVSYWSSMLGAPALRFASVDDLSGVGSDTVTAANMANLFDPSLDWDDLAEVRGWWHGPMLLKGPVSPEDARRAVSIGIDGIHLSNHGGRQLDRSLPTADMIAPLRQALGADAVIVVDSGIRHGADIATALALGADAAAIGRPYLYGLAAGGERGVSRALTVLSEQFRRTMQLMGVASVAELRQGGSALLRRRGPDGPAAG
jgi:L-lactate dehydrogenase (cytochrome)